jgi:hypothetical protein
LFALVHPHSSGDDAVFVHTSNPEGSEFPMPYWQPEVVTHLPPLLAGRVDLQLYSVVRQHHGAKMSFVVETRSTPS